MDPSETNAESFPVAQRGFDQRERDSYFMDKYGIVPDGVERYDWAEKYGWLRDGSWEEQLISHPGLQLAKEDAKAVVDLAAGVRGLAENARSREAALHTSSKLGRLEELGRNYADRVLLRNGIHEACASLRSQVGDKRTKDALRYLASPGIDFFGTGDKVVQNEYFGGKNPTQLYKEAQSIFGRKAQTVEERFKEAGKEARQNQRRQKEINRLLEEEKARAQSGF